MLCSLELPLQDPILRLNRLQMAELPTGVHPQLSPTSAAGEIYRYQLSGGGYSLMDLKVIPLGSTPLLSCTTFSRTRSRVGSDFSPRRIRTTP